MTEKPARRVRVDANLCEGHALCLETAPEVFALDDGDLATCTQHPVGDAWDRVQAAIDACPRGAISITEDC